MCMITLFEHGIIFTTVKVNNSNTEQVTSDSFSVVLVTLVDS
jgi:hypothetical protein